MNSVSPGPQVFDVLSEPEEVILYQGRIGISTKGSHLHRRNPVEYSYGGGVLSEITTISSKAGSLYLGIKDSSHKNVAPGLWHEKSDCSQGYPGSITYSGSSPAKKYRNNIIPSNQDVDEKRLKQTSDSSRLLCSLDSIKTLAPENILNTNQHTSQDVRTSAVGVLTREGYSLNALEEDSATENTTLEDEDGPSMLLREAQRSSTTMSYAGECNDIHNSISPALSALYQNPPGKLEIVDRDRPSLQRTWKTSKSFFPYGLSDLEDMDTVQKLWISDTPRKRKQGRRDESVQHSHRVARNNSPVIERVFHGQSDIESVKQEIFRFISSDEPSIELPPMNKDSRKIVHELSRILNIKSTSMGSGDDRHPCLYKSRRTLRIGCKDFETKLNRLLARYGVKRPHLPRQPRRTETPNGKYRDGEIVGGSAPELGIDNRGRAILEKMGWSNGTALGADNNKGIMLPVSHKVKNGKTGLG